jgi:phosphatidylserine decarboxylase
MSMQQVVQKLQDILESSPQLKAAVNSSLKEAQQPGITSLEQFYNYLDGLLTHIPTEKELMPSVRTFYFILGKSPDDVLKKDPRFNSWMNEFVRSRGDYLNTVESTKDLKSFIDNPEYKIEDYIQGPGGWLSYNQFLARQLKPGKRPVAARCNDEIIVSPADSTYMGQWEITGEATITVKGITYSMENLLNGSEYKDKFNKGIFTHSFLAITDYHRFHMPVSGMIREVRTIQAGTWVTEERKQDGSLRNTDDVGFQFDHTRAYIIIESPIGFVAVMPVGMGHISSVVITAEEGAQLVKGDEFGYFAFGGSDIIMLFQPQIFLSAKANRHYKQGEEIGRFIR